MKSIILQLQEEIVNSNIPLSDLLRKSLLIAKKLDLYELAKWNNNELGGYKPEEDVPNYRIINGHLVAHNGFREIPVILSKSNTDKIVKRKLCNPVAELEVLSKWESIYLELPMEFQEVFNEGGVSYLYRLEINPSQIIALLSDIKTTLLNFALNLEKQGILGDGIMFSIEEKQKASIFNTVNTTNTYVNAPVEYFQMQQNTKDSCQNMALNENGDINQSLEKILSAIDNLGLDKENRDELYAELQTIKFQMQSSKPKNMILRESWNTARNILEGVAAGLISSGLMNHVDKITQSIKNIT